MLGSMATRFLALTLLLVLAAACGRKPAPTVVPEKPAVPLPQLVPLPSAVEMRQGLFTLTAQTVIVAPGETRRFGEQLSDFIGIAVGQGRVPQPLTVETAVSGFGDGAIILGVRQGSGDVEGRYTLDVTEKSINIVGDDLAGVFYGLQTLRQLLPPAFEYEAIRPRGRNAQPVQIPALHIEDQPRFSWRGAMLDVARHFLTVEEVKRYVDLMALHKLNRLHLHLADDQGWRIEIRSWPRLTTHGGSSEVGGGPGGFYTQEQYADIVKYAADRFVTIVPEIDMPGHTNAALASYGELNCDDVARPLYTGTEVGFSAFCVEKEVTYKFIDDVVREIAALTPGPFFHIGGDEVKTLTAGQYNAFIERVQGIVQSHGKRVVGWDEIAAAKLLPGSIVQHWRPKTTPAEAIAKGAQVIMSIADRAYIDMKYDEFTPIGLTWAGIVRVQTAYEWDPATVAQGVPENAVLGVEAPLWAETIANINDVEFLAFPRLAAIAEMGWSKQADRTWEDFRVRLGAQGPRWVALGMNFYRSPEIPWK
jgi:hexosaminidase